MWSILLALLSRVWYTNINANEKFTKKPQSTFRSKNHTSIKLPIRNQFDHANQRCLLLLKIIWVTLTYQLIECLSTTFLLVSLLCEKMASLSAFKRADNEVFVLDNYRLKVYVTKGINCLTCLLIVGTLFFALAVGAAAEEETTLVPDESEKIEVTATYQDVHTTRIVYRLDIYWSDLDFIYQDNRQQVWDPATHTYSSNGEGAWTGLGLIKVCNHSNADVRVRFAYEQDPGYADVDGIFEADTLDPSGYLLLPTAEGTTFENAPAQQVSFQLTGVLPNTATLPTLVGKVVIYVEKGSEA